MEIARIISACNCWQDFKEAMPPLSKKEKGDCFEELTKQYLLIEPKYQTQLRHVWRLEEVPSKIRKHLNLPDQDEGIDLVAETIDGGYPDRAIAIWKKIAEWYIAQTNVSAYGEALTYLKKVRKAMEGHSKLTDWASYLASLTELNKRKSRLLQMLKVLSGKPILVSSK